MKNHRSEPERKLRNRSDRRIVAGALAACLCLAACGVAAVAPGAPSAAPSVPAEAVASAQQAASRGESQAAASASAQEGASGQEVAEDEAIEATDAQAAETADAAEAVDKYAAIEALEESDYVAGEVLVQIDPDNVDAVNAYLESADYLATKSVSADDAARGFATLELAEGVDLADAVKRLDEAEGALMAQPNYRYYAHDSSTELVAGAVQTLEAQAASVNDTKVSNQWALDAMHVPEAWALLKQSGRDLADGKNSVGVAVIDMGFDVDHVDLSGTIADTYNAVPAVQRDNPRDTSVAEVASQSGHGTHVAGIVGAQTNNGVGIAGVSYNSGLMLLKVYSDKCGATTQALLEAYAHIEENAQDKNIRVVNVSMGDATANDAAFKTAIEDAYDAGIVTVCSAGNDGLGSNYPSDFDKTVAVINVDKAGAKASDSNYNRTGERLKDISAPGTSIYSTMPRVNSVNKYGTKSGTSVAAPQVAGVLALMFAANPDLTAAQAVELLYSTTDDLNTSKNIDGTFDYETGWGLVNAKAAVTAALKTTGGATIPFKATASSPTVTFKTSAQTILSPFSVTGSKSRSFTKTSGASYFTVNSKTGAITVAKSTPAGTYNVGVKVAASGTSPYNAGSVTLTVKITVKKAANPASVSVTAPKALTFKTKAQTIANPLSVTGAQGAVTYTKASGNSRFTVNKTTGKVTVAKSTPAGTYTIGVKATVAGNANYNGTSATKTFKVKINKAANTLKVKSVKATRTVKASKKTVVAAKKAFKVTKNASKGKVTYKKASGPSKIVVAKSGKLTIKKGLKAGKTYTVKVKATSAAKGSYKAKTVVVKFKVNVK